MSPVQTKLRLPFIKETCLGAAVGGLVPGPENILTKNTTKSSNKELSIGALSLKIVE